MSIDSYESFYFVDAVNELLEVFKYAYSYAIENICLLNFLMHIRSSLNILFTNLCITLPQTYIYPRKLTLKVLPHVMYRKSQNLVAKAHIHTPTK